MVISLAVSLLQGCALFTSPKEQPVIEDTIGDRFTDWGRNKVGTLATTPERRVVVVKMPDNKFCAEPSPDVAESLTSAFNLIASAKTQTSADAQLNLAKSLATTAKTIFVRSQGVQLFRDGLYSLCQANLNGTISDAQYKDMFEQLLTTADKLIGAEIPTIRATKTEDAESSANEASTNAEGTSKTGK